MFRIGHGYDAHKFSEEDKVDAFITIGGVKIANKNELMAHSDGDVLLHALCDSLLGAIALGDIGKHFPDTDPQYKGINSRELLREVYKKVQAKGYKIQNADMTIVAQSPKMSPHIDAMIEAISEDCLCQSEQINVKATTTEKMGFTGRKEGISCHAVVLLEQIINP